MELSQFFVVLGETLEQREKGITLDFVKEQIVEAYVGVTKIRCFIQ